MRYENYDREYDTLLDVEEAAQLLKVSTGTIYTYVQTGFIPYIRLGKKFLRFNRQTLIEWLAAEEARDKKPVSRG